MWFWVKPEPPEKNVDRETALEDEDINVINNRCRTYRVSNERIYSFLCFLILPSGHVIDTKDANCITDVLAKRFVFVEKADSNLVINLDIEDD